MKNLTAVAVLFIASTAAANAQEYTVEDLPSLVKQARSAECPTLQRTLKNQIAAVHAREAKETAAKSGVANPCFGVKEAAQTPVEKLSPACAVVVANLDAKAKEHIDTITYEDKRLFGFRGEDEDTRSRVTDLTETQKAALQALADAKAGLIAVGEMKDNLHELKTIPAELTQTKAVEKVEETPRGFQLPEDYDCVGSRFRIINGRAYHCPPVR